MSSRTILVWFRNDLRVSDNEILLEATRKADQVLPVYCFDPYYFQVTPAGNYKTGNIRAAFLLNAVADLRNNLRRLGSDLIIRVGNPAEIIPQLAEEYHVNEVYHHREVSFEETAVSEALEAALWKIKLNLKHFIGHTLYHKEDLPFPIKDIPDSFATFKKKVERDSAVRPVVQMPDFISTPRITDAGELPTIEQLGLEEPVIDPRSGFVFVGGETAGLLQLKQHFESHQLLNLGKTARAMGQHGYGSRLSPWLALGCVSLRQVYWEAIGHEQGHHGANPIILELLWRDYFRFMFKKHGSQFFNAAGFKGEAPEVADNQDELFEKWKNGQTGVPFIDASMAELKATGFVSNHSRQQLAAYLVRELKVDWTRGAALFEERLIDYSPASNWGNWTFIAGVGTDQRENKYFNLKPVLDYDAQYIETWLSSPVSNSSLQGASI